MSLDLESIFSEKDVRADGLFNELVRAIVAEMHSQVTEKLVERVVSTIVEGLRDLHTTVNVAAPNVMVQPKLDQPQPVVVPAPRVDIENEVNLDEVAKGLAKIESLLRTMIFTLQQPVTREVKRDSYGRIESVTEYRR